MTSVFVLSLSPTILTYIRLLTKFDILTRDGHFKNIPQSIIGKINDQ